METVYQPSVYTRYEEYSENCSVDSKTKICTETEA